MVKRRVNLKNYQTVLIVALFAVVGVAMIVRSHAATPGPNPTSDATSSSTRTTLVGDLNNDGKVNIQDLALLLINFGKTSATPPPTPPGGGKPGLGVGDIPAANCSAANVVCMTSDSSNSLTITTSGKIYECQGHKLGRMEIDASNVTLQNCMLTGGAGEDVQNQGSNNTIQNNDITQVSLLPSPKTPLPAMLQSLSTSAACRPAYMSLPITSLAALLAAKLAWYHPTKTGSPLSRPFPRPPRVSSLFVAESLFHVNVQAVGDGAQINQDVGDFFVGAADFGLVVELHVAQLAHGLE